MGVFAQWQPVYAEAGIATFPVDAEAKKPAVGNHLKAGRPASAEWARKFPDIDALGMACGKRNRLTILDVDTDDDRVLTNAFARLGPSPVVARTASGKFHAYYLHNGERFSPRRVAREMGLEGPIDILGEGGFAVAPPSRNTKGTYEFVQGSLADLANLPVMRLVPAAANDSPTSSGVVGEGERNFSLFNACLDTARRAGSLSALLRFGHELNNSGQWTALSVDEVERTVASAWRIQVEGRNLKGKGRAVVLSGDETAILERDPDGLYLYTMLRKEHWGRDFVVANEWREHLASGAWSLPRFRAARNFLIQTGLIVEVRPASRAHGAALYKFASPAGAPRGEEGGGV